jgi:hypothetical protein
MPLEPIEPLRGLRTYSHPLVDWGAAIAGTLVAIGIGFTLLMLGVAIGATAVNPWQGASEQAPGWSIAGGLWVIFSNLVALQVGAYIAARAARWPDHHGGVLQGLVVWALAFAVAAGVLGFGVAGVLSGGDGMSMGDAAGRAVDAAQIATGEASGSAATLTPEEVDAIQDATALTAWWAVGAMVLGAIGAMAGGKLGSNHPDWHARERGERPVTMADKV